MHPEVLRLFSLWDLIRETTPSDRKAQGRPPTTSWRCPNTSRPWEKSSAILPKKPYKEHPFPWTTGFTPITQEMRYGLKTENMNLFSQFGQVLKLVLAICTAVKVTGVMSWIHHQSQEGSGFLWWEHLESSLGPQKPPECPVPKTKALTQEGRWALL